MIQFVAFLCQCCFIQDTNTSTSPMGSREIKQLVLKMLDAINILNLQYTEKMSLTLTLHTINICIDVHALLEPILC